MQKNTFFIGIDSGGTKTEILIEDTKGNAIHRKVFPAIHYSVYGKEKVCTHLKNAILKTLKEKRLYIKDCSGICIGLTGAREKEDKSEIQKRLSNLLKFKRILIESDSYISLYGAFEGDNGMILICGTGSILLGLMNKRIIRTGGWGWKIGDYGSGYELGRQVIKNLTSEYDNGKLSKLSVAVEKRFFINKQNLLDRVYRNNFEFQNLVPLLLEYAERKDKTAMRIIDSAVNELLFHIESFYSKTKHKEKINLAFSGGILENKNPLSEKLKKKIKSNFDKIILTNRKHTPAEGAILLAKNKFK